ncbi:CUT domain protein [Dictyocaulus viviparus]|uniref:Homeobox protein cut-like n=1 Tax=Dictyocaulus viviparus TaxID=29172 RepID=A0A0D8XPF8_DICVI|nr:CUT domain protein [Dictyocaulus viviparus]
MIDVTICKLRDAIEQLEEEKVKEVEKIVAEIEKDLRTEFSVRDHETTMRSDKLKAENAALEKKVSELEGLMREAQGRLDNARLAADRKEALENEQIDILNRDLSDANRKLTQMETELARLTAELEEARSSSQRGGLEDIAVLGGLMKEKDEKIARLTEDNRRLMETAAADAKKARLRCEELTAELDKKTQQVLHLESLLADQSDYEAIKKELRLLREIEFGEAATANEDSIVKLGETVQSLDRLLAAKNRRLQSDNAVLRQANERYQGDEIMQAILSGSHQAVVEAVSSKVGREVAEGYVENSGETKRMSKTYDFNRTKSDCDSEQNLYKILMKMGTVGGTETQSNADDCSFNSRTEKSVSPTSDIPFEHFHYSSKLTNYTGEPAKTPQELKAIQDLQLRVASNVRSLGGRALNTAEIARQCKRLMIAYNIGQRLFAKYVMNQSQGSLSELLSKPRHWSKLTDKGREAFRRIYGWISDAEAVELLCSLSPRRVWPSEVRIEHPSPESLWEGNGGRLPPEEADENTFKRAASAREDQYRLAGTNQASNAGSTTRNSRWRHDDIPKEKIMSIFQSELAKLREQTEDTSPYHEMSHNERMASISHAHQVMNARMRVGLSPIRQDQFEMFGHIDTEDVVRQIKEFLSMNSISQRQFGEHVLGLSQGSVSDLLARPKRWNMLTQKGREPFIRMKLFMREVSQSASRARSETAVQEGTKNHLNMDATTSVKHESPCETEKTSQVKVKREVSEEGDDIITLPRSEFDSLSVGTPDEMIESGEDVEDVDTALLVRKVKDRLHLHGISQRLFGEAVLGISAGGCSELFLRPRRWSTLSVRGREPFEKMKAWLADKDAIQRLLVRERIDAGLPLENNVLNGNGKRLSDPPYEPPPRKVQRTIITEQQKEALRFVFQHEHHPSQKTVELLSLKLNLNIRTVNNWFHNHRTRQKASLKEGRLYPPVVGMIPESKNWQQDLHKILENASRYALLEDAPPTMVPVVSTPLPTSITDEQTKSSMIFSNGDQITSVVTSSSPLTPISNTTNDDQTNSLLIFSNEDNSTSVTEASISPLFTSEERCERASQLDRAVAKMRLLAASKSS